MSRSVTGDFARLSRIVRGLGNVPELRRALSTDLRAGLSESYAEQFASGTSSTGSAWQANQRGTRTLVDTGRLSRARVALAVGKGGAIAEGRITLSPRYATYYQRDPRRVLPTAEADMGRWGVRVTSDSESAFRRWLGGLVG